MKAISVLGTASNAGKSWVATALCAWLRRQGVKVAPFKVQNMANNAFATLDGGEIGVAQAVQAEACGRRPTEQMNPILLKPNGENGSQVVRRGKAGETQIAQDYYSESEENWRIVRETLDEWRSCGEVDVLVLEGAGSPVELNLMDRDIVNLRPIEYLSGKWLLVSNIEYGGVFAQLGGTWNLLPEEIRPSGLGAIVNRFRGDLSLFQDAGEILKGHIGLPYLGALPYLPRLKIDDEDSMTVVKRASDPRIPSIAWIRFPHVSNSQDQLAWMQDCRVQSHWCDEADELESAQVIVLPGTKNTVSDLRWLKERGLDNTVAAAVNSGKLVIGICGGMQMLGTRLFDVRTGEREEGLGLCPFETSFTSDKKVCRNLARLGGDEWETYEIHEGRSAWTSDARWPPLLEVAKAGEVAFEAEGFVSKSLWGTYQHGFFDSPSARRKVVAAAGLSNAVVSNRNWREARAETYRMMADAIGNYLNLDTVKRYLSL